MKIVHISACMQAPKLRVQAQQLTKRFSSAIQMGVLKNLESLRITHMREENDVQVSCRPLHRQFMCAPGGPQLCKGHPCQSWCVTQRGDLACSRPGPLRPGRFRAHCLAWRWRPRQIITPDFISYAQWECRNCQSVTQQWGIACRWPGASPTGRSRPACGACSWRPQGAQPSRSAAGACTRTSATWSASPSAPTSSSASTSSATCCPSGMLSQPSTLRPAPVQSLPPEPPASDSMILICCLLPFKCGLAYGVLL